MCGIAGIVETRLGRSRVDLARCAGAMAATLSHRGPDDAGIWSDPASGIALGHRRLAIVDLSAAGHQPMISADGRCVLVYNGEIYNAGELRAELERRGRVFRGQSDTEVLLEGCAAWGARACAERLIGMFAFALWDRAERRLTLVRDRLGIKPLYWAALPDLFLFGSELKALCAHPGWTPEIDRGVVASYLRWGYVAGSRAVYRRVHKLEPGQLLTLQAGAAPRLERYWDLAAIARAGAAAPGPGSEDEAVERLDRLLRDAVRRRMVADVPLGAFLSGGIDSSTVAALMQVQSGRPVKTFSIGFREDRYNEADHARRVATHLGTEHTELYASPQDALNLVPRIPEWFDEPFGDASQIPTYLLAALTREHVTVALSGDGGDELFAGYDRYAQALDLWRRFGRVPPSLLRAAGRGIKVLPPERWDRLLAALPPRWRPRGGGARLHLAADHWLPRADPATLYRVLVSKWPDPTALVPGADEAAAAAWSGRGVEGVPDLLTRAQLLDALSYLPDDVLTKVDRTTMAVSLEARVPILDHRVVEFAFGLPRTMKVRAGVGKWLLRRVLDRYVPRPLVARPKQGFAVPLDQWLRGPLREWAEALLAPERLRRDGLLDPQPIRRAWERHLAGAADDQSRLWTVLMLQAWLDHRQAGGRGRQAVAAT